MFMAFVIFDTLQGIGASSIAASQQQKAGAIITAFAYWALGIPLTLYMVFVKDVGINGLWIGPTASVLFLTITYVFMFNNMDW